MATELLRQIREAEAQAEQTIAQSRQQGAEKVDQGPSLCTQPLIDDIDPNVFLFKQRIGNTQ